MSIAEGLAEGHIRLFCCNSCSFMYRNEPPPPPHGDSSGRSNSVTTARAAVATAGLDAEPSKRLKTEELPSSHNRRNLPLKLQQLRTEAEKLKKEIAPKWKELTDEKKLSWWGEFIDLLKGEVDCENKLMRSSTDEIEQYFKTKWENSKGCQEGELGKHHSKESAIIFALDKCFEADKKKEIIYFFKFTGEFDIFLDMNLQMIIAKDDLCPYFYRINQF